MRFVLVHGGWQGGWAWNGVSALLGARNPRRVACDGSHRAMLTPPDAVATAPLAATADTTGT